MYLLFDINSTSSYLFNRCISGWGLPRWLSVKEFTYQCRRHRTRRFNPWVGKIYWRRKWQPTPIFLPGKSHGQRSLVGYGLQGLKESDTTRQLSTLKWLKTYIHKYRAIQIQSA